MGECHSCGSKLGKRFPDPLDVEAVVCETCSVRRKYELRRTQDPR